MQNSPELNGKYLGTITKDFAVVAHTLKDAAYQIKKHGFEYPIFPVSKSVLPIGELLLAKEDVAIAWNFNASYLEEFVQLKLIESERVEDFKKAYKDIDEFCCLFVVDGEFNNFVFIPYPEDED
ncbi:hypothetical protein FUAX_33460 [Fulvitalea axinellae]|uniref:Uncharacterized protein n=1 Tax=Fulvitalea axinellae TaxID=1182444 RepID=A0AAU9CWP6_9BACT|nr:hypothetical protein FUAX_33460 [Fulvitalea axinellae]